MQDIDLTLSQITKDFPEITFAIGEDFYWQSASQTVFHPAISSLDDLHLLLHEVGHAALQHADYDRDINLLDMERQAWQYAISELSPKYLEETELIIEASELALDSYREWLSKRSTCPACSAIGIEVEKNSYECLVCSQAWRVNQAKNCQLRRYKK